MSTDAFRLMLEALSADYRRELPQKFDELDLIWDALIRGSSPPARMVDLQRELHTLVGTAKTMGVPAVTEAAREAENFLEPFVERGMIPTPAEREQFKDLLTALKRSAHE